MKNVPEHIDESLLLKILDNIADAQERILFENWLNASSANEAIYNQLKKVYSLSVTDNDSLKRNWDVILSKVNKGESVPEYIELPGTAQSFALKPRLNTMMKIAALFTLLIGISFLVKVLVFGSEQLIIYGNDLNPKNPYHLKDGSLVYLNKNAEISFSKKFGKKDRKLTLKGEAFFDIKRDERNPFVISTYETAVKVLGTKFNIYSDSSMQVKVSVISGLVEFREIHKGNKLMLAAGESGKYNPENERIGKETEIDQNFIAWKTGILHFEDTPLPAAFTLLQKQYARTFVYKAQRSALPNLTTTVDNMPLNAVLEELNLLLNTKNVFKNDTVFFISNN